MFEETFRLSEYREGEAFRTAGFDVTPVRVPHYAIEAYAFRVADGTSVLAYSGDSGPSDALAELARSRTQEAEASSCWLAYETRRTL